MSSEGFILPHPLHSKQERFIKAALSGKYRIIAAISGRQWGKSIAEGSIVRTISGAKPIQDIKIGDYVITLTANQRIATAMVTDTINHGVIPALCIETASGKTIVCSHTHPLFTPSGWHVAEQIQLFTPIGILSFDGFKWDHVVSKSYHKDVRMYDLEVEDTHNFVANDIFVHNSFSGAWILASTVIKNWELDDAAYLACAPSYKTMEGGMMQSFNKVFAPLRLGKYNKNDKVFTCNNGKNGRPGHRIYFRSMDSDLASEGVTDVLGVWADEAGQYPYPGWMNIQGRTSRLRAPIWITTTPYGLGWLYTEIYLPWDKGEELKMTEGDEEVIYKARDYIYIVQGWSNENPSFQENMALQRRRMGEQEFMRLYSGTFQQLQGLVYSDFRRQIHVIPLEDNWKKIFRVPYPQIPPHFSVSAGVDWGSSEGNPFAVAVVAYGPAGISYQVDEVLKHNLSGTDMINIMVDLQKLWGINMFHCDNDPKMIEDMLRKGLHAKGTDKSAGVPYGIGQHRSLIRLKRRLIFDNCQFTISAYQTYAYRKISTPDRSPHAKPSHLMSDLMDALRYDTIGNPEALMGIDMSSPHVSSLDTIDGETSQLANEANDAEKRIHRIIKSQINISSGF